MGGIKYMLKFLKRVAYVIIDFIKSIVDTAIDSMYEMME
jgi:hypothetical protein